METTAKSRFEDNVGLVYSIANTFIPLDISIDREDILQEGFIGLWEACLKFDESSGNEFSSFAYPTIKGSILQMINKIEPIKTSRSSKVIKRSIESHGFSLPLNEEEVSIILKESNKSCKLSKNLIEKYRDVSVCSLEVPVRTIINESPPLLKEVIPSDDDLISSYLLDNSIETIIDELIGYLNMKDQNKDIVREWLNCKLRGQEIRQEYLINKFNTTQPAVSRALRVAVATFLDHKEEIIELFGL